MMDEEGRMEFRPRLETEERMDPDRDTVRSRIPEEERPGRRVASRSDVLEKHFGSRIRALIEADDLMSFPPEIARFDMQLDALLDQIEAGDAPAWRRRLHDRVREFDAVVKSRNPALLVESLATLWPEVRQVVEEGRTEADKWDALLVNGERRANMVAKALTAFAQAQKAVSDREMVQMFGRILDIICAEVDHDSSGRIASRVEAEVFGIRTPHFPAHPALEAGARAYYHGDPWPGTEPGADMENGSDDAVEAEIVPDEPEFDDRIQKID